MSKKQIKFFSVAGMQRWVDVAMPSAYGIVYNGADEKCNWRSNREGTLTRGSIRTSPLTTTPSHAMTLVAYEGRDFQPPTNSIARQVEK